ncbi:hypothetical protein ACFQ4K_12345 [Tistrella bauzanensis]
MLALLSQLLVPWGALAIGTQVTAVLMRHDPHQLGAAAAAVSAIAYAGGLVVLRLQLAAVGIRPRRRDRLIDPPLVAGLIVALVVANLFLGPETAALAALGLPIAIDLGVRRRDVAIRTTTRILAPYLALTLVLLVTRLVTPLAEALRHWIWQPVDGLPGYAPLHHPAGWLLATAVVAALMAGNRPGRIGHDIARGLGHGIRPAAATIAFVLLAGVWAAGGAPTVLAAAWRDVAAGADLAIIPPLAGLAGFLTGSNVAVAAMIAPLADALPGMGADGGGAGALMALLIAAMLLVVGGLATMVSPMRLAMAAALTGAAASDEAAIRRRSTPCRWPWPCCWALRRPWPGCLADGRAATSGRIRWWDAAAIADDDSGTILRPHDVAGGGAGRWRRDVDGMLDIVWFGAVGDNDTDCTTALQAVFNAARTASGGAKDILRVDVPVGRFVFKQTLCRRLHLL